MERPDSSPSQVFFIPAEGFTLYYVSASHQIVSCQTSQRVRTRNKPRNPGKGFPAVGGAAGGERSDN